MTSSARKASLRGLLSPIFLAVPSMRTPRADGKQMPNKATQYRPYYVWPNPAFPFRLYYEGRRLRIFIIENLQHNYTWLSKYRHNIREGDHFFVILGSHWDEEFLNNADQMFEYLGLDKNKFFIMYNDNRDNELFTRYGFIGDVINQNAWLDYNETMRILPDIAAAKKYDAIYVGRLIKAKRHYLASEVRNLALVSGPLHGNNVTESAPAFMYKNSRKLSPDEVCTKINQSCCGLILSEKEGACFASSEYLLCGVPVVSTYSEGGRADWYDDYNSIVVPPVKEKVAAAVATLVKYPRDPRLIRKRHIAKANYYRAKFVSKISTLFLEYDVIDDPMEYFVRNYFHKMRKSFAPDFDQIFGK